MEPQELTPEEAKASLGIATYLQQQILPQGTPIDGDTDPQSAQQGTETAPMGEDVTSSIKDLEIKITDELDEIKSQLGNDNKQKEIDSIRKELEQLLEKEDGNEE